MRQLPGGIVHLAQAHAFAGVCAGGQVAPVFALGVVEIELSLFAQLLGKRRQHAAGNSTQTAIAAAALRRKC